MSVKKIQNYTNKFSRIFFLFLAVSFLFPLFLSSCVPSTPVMEASISTVQLSATVIQLKSTYKQVSGIISSNLNKFSPTEQKTLKAVNQNISDIIEIINSWGNLSSVGIIPVSWNSIVVVYNKAKESYLLAKNIISKHMDLFSTKDALILANFDQNAKVLDQRIQLMKTHPETINKAKFLMDTLQATITLGKVLLPLVSSI